MNTAIEKTSLQEVVKNLNKEIKGIEGRCMKGYLEGARIIRYDMDKTPPLIPVYTGNLRQSWFTSPAYRGNIPVLYFGFSANYALKVHEMYGAHFRRPNAGAGFFVLSIKRNKKNILNAIKENAKVKK